MGVNDTIEINGNACLIFCKSTGTLLGEVPATVESIKNLNHDLVDYKILNISKNEAYIGDFKTGKIVNSFKRPVFFESEIYKEFEEKFFTQVNLFDVIQIILEMLNKNCSNHTENFKRCYKIYSDLRLRAIKKVDVVKNSPESFEFISYEDEALKVKNKLEAALNGSM